MERGVGGGEMSASSASGFAIWSTIKSYWSNIRTFNFPFPLTSTVAKFMPIQFYQILKVSTVLYMLKLFFYLR